MKTVCIIPARLESKRLQKKLLRIIQGKPLIQHTYESVKKAKSLDRVLVACDSKEIFDVITKFGGEVFMSKNIHENGTDRVAELAKLIDADIIVNVQGDEPLINKETIDSLVYFLDTRRDISIATACIFSENEDEYNDPNIGKVVKDVSNRALYFSRSPIPKNFNSRKVAFYKHIGIYAFRKSFLEKIDSLPYSALQDKEGLEQLKWLEAGYEIGIMETHNDSVGVNTEEDFKNVENIMKNNVC